MVQMELGDQSRGNKMMALSTSKGQRVSVSFTPEQYDYLTRTAGRLKVSIAWVVRDAVDRLVTEEAPLFKREKR
jgi:hypothetical protein